MPRTLLLADDSITIQKVVAITFANEDFTVTAVDNGEDALAKAREIKPDIILADVVMPRRNGYELCQAIKSDPALRSIPVLLLAGTFEAFDEGKAVAAQANGHIVKPFDSQVLIDRVNAIVSGQPMPSATPVAPRPTVSMPAPVAAPPPPAAPPAFAIPRPPVPGGMIPGIPVQRSPSIAPPPPPVPGGGLPPLSRPPMPPAVAAPPRPPSPFIPGAGLPPVSHPIPQAPTARPAFLGNPTPMLVPGGLPPVGAPAPAAAAPAAPATPSRSPFLPSANTLGGSTPPPGITIGRPSTRPPTPAPVQPRPMSPTPAPWAVSASPAVAKPVSPAAASPSGVVPRSSTMAWSTELGIPAAPVAPAAPPAQRAKPTPTPMWGVPVAKTAPAVAPTSAPTPYTPGLPKTLPSVVVDGGISASSSDLSMDVAMDEEPSRAALDLPLDDTPLELEPPSTPSAASLRASASVQLDISEAADDGIRTSSLSDLAQGGSAPVGEIEIEADGSPEDQVELAPANEFVPAARKPEPAPWSAPPAVAAPRPPTTPPAPVKPSTAPSMAADGGEGALRTALSQASREVIEKIAWEVVPQLAEVIIREHVERLVRERSSK